MTLKAVADKLILLDGDLLRYRCGFAAEKANKDDDQGFERVRSFIDDTIRGITGSGQDYPCEIWLSGPTNFRTAIGKSQPYKGNRQDRAKPCYFEEIGDYLAEEFGATYSRGGLEADDELSIRLSEDPRGRCIASNDKDFLQVSGWHYNWVNGTCQWISRKDGDFNLFAQILQGDRVDNIAGLEGIGPVKAKGILKGSESSRELCQRTWDAYRAHGRTREYFEEQATLIYLLRSSDDSFQARIKYMELT